MPSLNTLLPVAGAVSRALLDPATCSGDLPASCSNSTTVDDTCCFLPAGHLVLTQFWDTEPVTGPEDSLTLHGLWPDWCDGSYPAECDDSRAYSNISDILTSFGADDTLSYMREYWKDYQGDDEQFWEHEWVKHGTCVSTLEPECYTDYQPTEEAVAYFSKTVELFKTLPTYKWLADAGITPDASQTYSLSEIESVLEAAHGAPVTVGCDGDNLNEIWYHFHVQGSLQSGDFIAAEPVGSGGGCPDDVSFLPKTGGSSRA